MAIHGFHSSCARIKRRTVIIDKTDSSSLLAAAANRYQKKEKMASCDKSTTTDDLLPPSPQPAPLFLEAPVPVPRHLMTIKPLAPQRGIEKVKANFGRLRTELEAIDNLVHTGTSKPDSSSFSPRLRDKINGIRTAVFDYLALLKKRSAAEGRVAPAPWDEAEAKAADLLENEVRYNMDVIWEELALENKLVRLGYRTQ